jgi:hypothetical protein
LFISKFSHKFYISTIIKGVEIDYNGYVYNLSIEGDETYIADGFVVHNCRSLRVPVVKDEFRIDDGLGRRPQVGADGPKAVSSKRTFESFLRDQPADFQDEYFIQFPDGLEKAALFRRGGLTVDRFRDETGRNYTLEQLKALEPVAFNKANLGI